MVTYSMKTEAGRVRFDNPSARRIVAALAQGPQPLRHLGQPANDLVANALALASADIIRPVNERDTAVSALNNVLAELDNEAIPLPLRALPSGTALELNLPCTVTCASEGDYRGAFPLGQIFWRGRRAWPRRAAHLLAGEKSEWRI